LEVAFPVMHNVSKIQAEREFPDELPTKYYISNY